MGRSRTGPCRPSPRKALRREVESLLAHDGGAAVPESPAVANDIGGGIRSGHTIGRYTISAQLRLRRHGGGVTERGITR